MTESTPILFVSHEGTRTGAPMMLLHFLRWLRDNSTIDPQVALIRGGPLAPEFAEVGPTTVLSEDIGWPEPTSAEQRLARMRLSRAARNARIRAVKEQTAPLRDARIVYLNSAASLHLLHHLPQARTAIAHVHELQSALHWSLRDDDPPLLRHRIDHVVTAADCVARNLTARWDVPADRITRVYEFIDADRVTAPPHEPRAVLRERLGLGPDDLIVGGSGFADWRKGIDLFVQLARTIRQAGHDEVHFVWVGDRAGGSERDQLDFDIERAGLGDRIHLVGLQSHPSDWYRAFDVFALTSREDPYPLVGLETALLGVPMVCFDAGGMTELVARSTDEGLGESGVVVPYIDVEAMAEAIIGLLGDPERRARVGQLAGEVVRRDHEVEVAGPQLLEVIERVVGRSLR